MQDLQLFTYFYSDGRSVVKTDNREAATRTADTADIELITLGAHYITLLRRGEYPIDALLWGAGQFGDWGEQDHAALAFTAEIGASMAEAALRPGLRIGFTYGSGDSDPNDGDHGTFFQMLPTARAYAATPFYNMQNTSDLFVQLSAQPAKGVTLRTELHQLWLSDSSDLFYSGAGANERRDRFGYTGTPSGGSNDIGTLLDLEVSWIATRYLTLTAYYGHLFGDNVVAAAAQGGDDDIDYFFLEVLLLFS
ncbi:MAG: alginate export family protein [Deltaproteobacteria bacterium]|nr:alginate export family protein [Deltaproteobacteria bacterium]